MICQDYVQCFKDPAGRVVIAIPHDGLNSHDFKGIFTERTFGVRGRDAYTWPIAKDILLGCKASGIRGLLPRAFVDYNRGQPGTNYIDQWSGDHGQVALVDERLLGSYLGYHGLIGKLLAESIAAYDQKEVLLIDFHGFAKQPPYAPKEGYDLILGTGTGTTLYHDRPDVLLTTHLRSRGYTVFLPGERYVSGRVWYGAGFTTHFYAHTHRINAIQIECHSRFRTYDKEGERLGRQLASDLGDFFHEYFR